MDKARLRPQSEISVECVVCLRHCSSCYRRCGKQSTFTFWCYFLISKLCPVFLCYITSTLFFFFPSRLTNYTNYTVVCCCCQVTSVVSDSVRPRRQQPTRLPHPWDSPGKNTGVGCHFLLQCIKVKSLSRDPMDCSLPGSSIHGFSRQEYWSWPTTIL